MQQNKITMHVLEPRRVYATEERVLRVSKWRIVTAIRRWLFERVATPAFRERYETVSIQTDDILQCVQKARCGMRAIVGAGGAKIYMGPEQFYRMANQQAMRWPIAFSFDAPVIQNRKTQLLGCDVEVLPWMDGVLVVPKKEAHAPAPQAARSE